MKLLLLLAVSCSRDEVSSGRRLGEPGWPALAAGLDTFQRVNFSEGVERVAHMPLSLQVSHPGAPQPRGWSRHDVSTHHPEISALVLAWDALAYHRASHCCCFLPPLPTHPHTHLPFTLSPTHPPTYPITASPLPIR
jgi:hypothetical protein